MVKELTDTSGLVKVGWSDVREKVFKVEPRFTKIVDELNPDKSLPLYLAYYPYGAVDADTISSLFPDKNGNYYRLTDTNAPKDVVTNLGYSKNNTPLGMVLEKQIECFIDLKNEKITIPWLIYTEGKIFPFTRILQNKKNGRIYAPNGLLSSTAGARSVFMLPNIGCITNHINLQRDFGIESSPPKSLYDHWGVFKEIVQSKVINSDWRCCVLYFSEKWIEKINNDQAWNELKYYLHELAWNQFSYNIYRLNYDAIFSIIQKNRNLKPNPYLADTARHLFATAIGATPGYVPALNDNALPLDVLQKAYIESYDLKKYIPTIMQPMHFSFEKDTLPIYYSLQNPATHVFSPKSRTVSSTLYEMRELDHIMKVFIKELSKENSLCESGSVLSKIAKSMRLHYFHNKVDSLRVLKSSAEIINFDNRFISDNKNHGAAFACDAPFVRGCISISAVGSS